MKGITLYLEKKKRKHGNAKWIQFCEAMLEKNYKIKISHSKKSKSKYVYVEKRRDASTNFATWPFVVVRFSDHEEDIKYADICVYEDSDFEQIISQVELMLVK